MTLDVRVTEAAEHVSMAVDLFRSMDMPFWLTQAETERIALGAL
jgi:hypothetical protein